jgi:hypothetical protein
VNFLDSIGSKEEHVALNCAGCTTRFLLHLRHVVQRQKRLPRFALFLFADVARASAKRLFAQLTRATLILRAHELQTVAVEDVRNGLPAEYAFCHRKPNHGVQCFERALHACDFREHRISSGRIGPAPLGPLRRSECDG